MSQRSLRRRAADAATILVARSLVLRAFSTLSYLVVVRFLSPRDLGVAAIGLSITFFGQFLTDAGLGAAMIRGKVAPDRRVFAALVALQGGAVSLVLVGLGIWAALARSDVAFVAVLYTASLLPGVLGTQYGILRERELDFMPLFRAEVWATLVSTAVTVAGAAAGFGVYALAAGGLVKSIVGLLALRLGSGVPVTGPRWDLEAIKPFLRFGMRVEAGSVAVLARDQGINYGTAALAGFGVLGIWSLSTRIMLIPSVLYDAVWRVSFPAFARMHEAGEDLRRPATDGSAIVAVIVAGALVPVVCSAYELLPVILGDEWRSLGSALPWMAASTACTIPVTSVSMGVLMARGDARTVFRITVAMSAVTAGVTLALVSPLGVTGMGIGMLAGALVDGALYVRAAGRLGIGLARPVVVPVLAGVGAVVLARVGATAVDAGDIVTGVLSATTGTAAYLALLWALSPSVMRQLGGMLRRRIGNKAPDHVQAGA